MLVSKKLFEEARLYIPGGVNSPVRAWKAVGGDPLFVQRGKGCRITDVEGNELIDYVASWGPLIAGHAHPVVIQAVEKAIRNGTSFGAPTAKEIQLAKEITTAIPGVEKVRLVSSGTEATMTALRLARGYTGRDKVVKFSGCYHGHHDGLLVKAGSGAMTFSTPDSEGVPEAFSQETLVAEFNDLASVQAQFDLYPDKIAAIIVEPVPGNMGVITPEEGFLEGLREVTRSRGAVLIFDEVMTGFRLGYSGAQGVYGVKSDLTCLGKVVGGGMPLAAVGGKAEILDLLAPMGGVYQAGTLSGNPVAVTAGIETMKLVKAPGAYEKLSEMGTMLADGLRSVLRQTRTDGCVNQIGSMLTIFFGIDKARDFNTVRNCNVDRFGTFFRGMIDQGVYLPPSQFESAFVSLAHGEDEVEQTIVAAKTVLSA